MATVQNSRNGNKIGSFTDRASDAVHWDDDRLREPLDFDDGKGFLLRSAVRHIDDFSLQKVPSMEFPENLGRIGDIHVAYSKIDPSVSHIWEGCRRERGERCKFLRGV